MRVHHKRRKRRQANMTLRSGGRFAVRHRLKAGRTGSVHAKRERGRREEG
jgi:hypothetical protein